MDGSHSEEARSLSEAGRLSEGVRRLLLGVSSLSQGAYAGVRTWKSCGKNRVGVVWSCFSRGLGGGRVGSRKVPTSINLA